MSKNQKVKFMFFISVKSAMGMHQQEFLLSLISISIANFDSRKKSFFKNKDRNDGPLIRDIYSFCKKQLQSMANDIYLTEGDGNEGEFSVNESNNKRAIAGMFSIQ